MLPKITTTSILCSKKSDVLVLIPAGARECEREDDGKKTKSRWKREKNINRRGGVKQRKVTERH
jgi:hypothetical protein